MKHLITRKTGPTLEVVYEHSPDSTEPYFTFTFTRIGIGVVVGDHSLYAVVVGERTYWGTVRNAGSRAYVVLDEREHVAPGDLSDSLRELKDIYYARYLYIPNSPRQFVESLRNQEGLSRYTEHAPTVLREQFPTFVERGLTAAIVDMDSPKPASIHRDIEMFLSETVRDIDTGEEKTLTTGEPVPRLIVPTELNTKRMDTAIRQSDNEICTALWFVLMGLESSRPPSRTRKRKRRSFESRIETANPTGY